MKQYPHKKYIIIRASTCLAAQVIENNCLVGINCRLELYFCVVVCLELMLFIIHPVFFMSVLVMMPIDGVADLVGNLAGMKSSLE